MIFYVFLFLTKWSKKRF